MKNYNLKSLLIATLIITGFVFNGFGQKSVDLKYKLTKGDNYSYSITMDQDIVFKMNGQPMAVDYLMDFYSTSTVADYSADSITISGKIDRIKSTQGFMGMSITYDSDDPSSAQNPMAANIAKALGDIVGKGYTQVMDTYGNIVRMDFSDISGDDKIANSMNSGAQFGVYPKHSVSVGESWESDIKPVKGSDMQLKVTYTLLKITGKTATIGLTGTIKANSMEDVELKMDGTQKGEMSVDLNTGWLIESKVDQEIEMEIEQNGQVFPATVSGTITTVSTKK